MRLPLVRGVTALALCLVACGPPSLGEEVSIDDLCKPANNDKRVSVSGYFSSEGFLTLCSTQGSKKTCSFSLRKSADQKEPSVTIHLVMGDGENQMKDLPEEFKSSDVQIKAVDGKVVGEGGHMKVTGKALIGEGSCQILDAERIDAI